MLVAISHYIWNFSKQAHQSKTPQLVTLAYSHYVESARWSLEYGGIKFQETGYAPGQHILPTLSIRIDRTGKKHFSNSSSVADIPGKTKNSPTSSPVMVHPDGSIDRDSWEISARANLKPIDSDLKDLLDKEFGPLCRQWVYFYLLKPEHSNIFSAMCTDGRHWFWKMLWNLGFGNILTEKMVALFDSHNEMTKKQCVVKLEVIIEKLSTILRTRPGKFLGGDELGQADIALASLCGAIIFPDLYAGGLMTPFVHQMKNKDKEFSQEVERWRKTEVGSYCMDLYSQWRLAKITRKN